MLCQRVDAASVMASLGIRYVYQSDVLSLLLSDQHGEVNMGVDGDDDRNDNIDETAIVDSNGATPPGVAGSNNSKLPHSRGGDTSLFHLEPPITELLTYEPVAELAGRRRTVPPEVRNVLYLETQKALLTAKVEEAVPFPP